MNKLKICLRFCFVNLRWIMLAIIVGNAAPIIEKGTASGLDDETAIWSTFVVIVTVGLFVFDKKYQKTVSKYFPK